MKKIIALLIAISMLLSVVPVFAALENEGTLTWEERGDIENVKDEDREWHFRPYPDTRAEQNPPGFSWPVVDGATSYDLVVARDKEFNDIAYKEYGLTENFHNFPYLMETGVVFYWAVRYHSDAGTSKWTEPSRFLILPEAYEFVVPTNDEVLERLKKWGHPKNIYNVNNLEEFRTYKDKYESAKAAYDRTLKSAHQSVAAGIATADNNPAAAGPSLYNTAFAYLIGEDKTCGEFVKKQILEMATWDINKTMSYVADSNNFRESLLNMAVAFDWCYDLFSEDEKKVIINAIRERMIKYENPKDGKQDKVWNINISPHGAHGINGLVNYFLPACLIMVNEIPEAEAYVRQYLPRYLNIAPTYSNEDGNWRLGVNYWSFVSDNIVFYTLKELTGINIYDKAWYQNQANMILYLIHTAYNCEFCDGGNGEVYDGNHDSAIRQALVYSGNPVLKWKLETFGMSPILDPFLYIYSPMIEQIEASEAPTNLPRSHVFRDTGVAALHSNLIDDADKISLYFRASEYGSLNHSHPDQNSFHIHAFGERMAIDSGYYDSYGSTFDVGYTKKSYAHNTITFDGGQGQPYGTAAADGKIINFLNHPDFDLISGDAAEAYNYSVGGRTYIDNLEKFDRHIIYLRPDTYIVLDDLKASNGKEVQFEWWLNAEDDLSLYESRTGAEIIRGNVALDTKIQYPKVKGYYSDLFSGPELIHLKPVSGDPPVSQRVWFETPKTNATRIVATMGVRTTVENPTYVKSEQQNGAMLLTFEDGTRAYISLEGNPIDYKGIKTDADAVVIKGESIMMVDGTYLERRGEKIISSDKKVSVTLGKREIGVSAMEDAEITVKTGTISGLKSQLGIVEEEKQSTRGFYWECNEGITNIKVYPGFYNYMYAEKPLPGAPVNNSTLTYYVDGVEKKAELMGYINHDEKAVLSGNIQLTPGFYTVEDINDVKFKGGIKGARLILNASESIMISGENPVLKLNSASSVKFEAEKVADQAELKENLDVFIEAEKFSEKTGEGNTYNTRKFMSGGAGVTAMNVFGDSMTWEVNVPEAGIYDVVINYVSWSAVVPGAAERIIEMNNILGLAEIPVTDNYGSTAEDWISTRVKTKFSLKKGVNKLTIYPISGLWNIDWIGLVKSE